MTEYINNINATINNLKSLQQMFLSDSTLVSVKVKWETKLDDGELNMYVNEVHIEKTDSECNFVRDIEEHEDVLNEWADDLYCFLMDGVTEELEEQELEITRDILNWVALPIQRISNMN